MAEEHKKHSEHKEREKHHKKKIKKIVMWQSLTVILAILFIASILTGGFKGAAANKISAKSAAEKGINFINANLLQPGMGAKLESVSEKNGLYVMTISIAGREYDSYVTLDGNLLFPSSFDMNQEIEAAAETQTPQNIPKTDKPEIELYVMSFCPFGNRAEDTMLPVYEALKDKAEWNVHYIVSVAGDKVSSLHGQPEADQDIREVCVKKNYGLDKLWGFITYVNENCGSDGSCWEDAAKEAGVSADKIQECYNKEGIELMKAEAQASNSAGASGSPTLIINGVQSSVVYQYGNSEAYKQAICSAFSELPEECSGKELSSSSQTAGTASTGGSCG